MKESLLNFTGYNLWANTRIADLLKNNSSLLDKEMKSSFSSLRKTLYHIWGAEELWWKRLHGESLSKVPAMDFPGSFDEAITNFLSVSKNFSELVKSKDENYLQTNCNYKDTRGNSYSQPHWQMIMHCMNHSTFHRGQLITMLRELVREDSFGGVTTIPATDMIVFFREKK